jgi:uncharacterized UBP type Zn finger protein
MNNKQIVVTGLKDIVIFIVIFNTCITRMIAMKEVTKRLPFQKTVEFLNYILGELQRTKQSVKMTPVAAVKLVKQDIALNSTISVRYGSGGSKIWI